MPTHHAQTALRMADQTGDKAANAVVHAELETAAQVERIADMLTEIKNELVKIGEFAFASGLFGVIPGAIHKVFNPEDN